MQKVLKSTREDPTKNKSLAIRLALKDLPHAKAKEVVDTVKSKYGQDVSQNMVYIIKTKIVSPVTPKLGSNATWIEAVSTARNLLRAAGNVENAYNLLKAVS
jgi:hypothetical protein